MVDKSNSLSNVYGLTAIAFKTISTTSFCTQTVLPSGASHEDERLASAGRMSICFLVLPEHCCLFPTRSAE